MNAGQLVTFKIRPNNLYSRFPGYRDSLSSFPVGLIVEVCNDKKYISYMIVWSDHPGKILAYSQEEIRQIQ